MKKILAGFLILLFSCSKSRLPAGILKPEKMQAVFWDFIRADVYANEYIRRDSSKNVDLENIKLQQQVFKLHKVTKEEFYRSYDYYLKHPALMGGMMDTMLVRRQKINEIKVDTLRTKPIE
jgi:hypothetical protein